METPMHMQNDKDENQQTTEAMLQAQAHEELAEAAHADNIGQAEASDVPPPPEAGSPNDGAEWFKALQAQRDSGLAMREASQMDIQGLEIGD
ncbi:MAG: hypothetical protein ACK4N1_05925 [Pseudorhizobium sp.]|jgi:hypothetical protein